MLRICSDVLRKAQEIPDPDDEYKRYTMEWFRHMVEVLESNGDDDIEKIEEEIKFPSEVSGKVSQCEKK